MYKIITLAAAASLLTLAACNRETETAPAGDDAAANAMAADKAATDASAGAPAASSSRTTSSSAGSGSETMASAGSSMTATTGTGVGPVTEETRANAQQAAEETNLHPKPPMN